VTTAIAHQVIYWRRDLPPLSEVVEGTHEVEADSPKIHNDLTRRPELWKQCYAPLLEAAERRATQELARLGGSCAHMLDEQIVAKLDDATGEFWLHGRFRFVMYRHPPRA
jgi:hypothetical protein